VDQFLVASVTLAAKRCKRNNNRNKTDGQTTILVPNKPGEAFFIQLSSFDTVYYSTAVQ
jgi:hypothetical protein